MSEVRAHRRMALVVPAVLAAAVYVWGGYAMGWAWTGLSGDVALWDWLEALALPVTVGLLPLLLQHHRRLQPRHKGAALVVLVAFGCLVLAGYLVPLRWTGFTGNTLWDWLELALLPFVLATASFWPSRDDLHATHRAVIGSVAAVFAVLVLAGYLVPLGWTGFTDNTAWDWVKLLLLPVLLPTLVLPALRRYLADRVASEAEPAGG
jgi:hypothetical protein